jgi:hypothetical protein
MKELLRASELREKYTGAQKHAYDEAFTNTWDFLVDEINFNAKQGGTSYHRSYGIPFSFLGEEKTKEVLLDVCSQLTLLGYEAELNIGTRVASLEVEW